MKDDLLPKACTKPIQYHTIPPPACLVYLYYIIIYVLPIDSAFLNKNTNPPRNKTKPTRPYTHLPLVILPNL